MMSVSFSRTLLVSYLLIFFTEDWSEDQVDKHIREIQSQLGNYFLRVTSVKLATRAKEASSSSLVTSHSTLHPLNAELTQMVESLPHRIQERMDSLEAGEALNEIISVLRMVSLIPVLFLL